MPSSSYLQLEGHVLVKRGKLCLELSSTYPLSIQSFPHRIKFRLQVGNVRLVNLNQSLYMLLYVGTSVLVSRNNASQETRYDKSNLLLTDSFCISRPFSLCSKFNFEITCLH